MKQSIIIGFCLFLLSASGCGSNLPLSGKVVFSDDGSPLTAGTVMFEGGTMQARGVIQPDGTYRVGTKKLTDGIPAGTYKAYISGAVTMERAKIRDARGELVDGMAVYTPLVAQKFTSPESSGLNIVVNRSTKTFDIEVDRPK